MTPKPIADCCRHDRSTGAAILCFAVLLAGLVFLSAAAHADEVSLLDGRCTLTVPAGWRVDNNYGDAGLVLYPPDPRAWPVELAIWAVPEGAAETAKAAALAHEAAIRRDYPYTRRESTEFRTTGDLQGQQVTGEVEAAGNQKVNCVFVAFAAAGRYYVLGTFSFPQQLDMTVSRYLAPVARDLRINARVPKPEPKPLPEPVPAPEPIPAPQPAPVVNSQQPIVGPPLPVVRPTYDTDITPATPAAGGKDLYLISARQLQLKAPGDYKVELLDGKWLVHPEGMESTAIGLLVWPLVCRDDAPTAAQTARTALQHWSVSAGRNFDLRPQGDGSAVIFSGTGSSASGQLRVLGTCTVAGDSALLTALYVVPDRAPRDWPMLVEMLGTVEVDPLPLQTVLRAPTTCKWQAPDTPGFSLPVPEGWLVRGGIVKHYDVWAISVEVLDPGPRRRYISWKQPLVPLFRELTSLLEGLGYKETDRYVSNVGGQPYTVLSHLTPVKFLEDYWSRETRVAITDAHVIEQSQPDQLKYLVNATDVEAIQAVVEGTSVLGPRRNHYLLAIGGAQYTGIHNWQAAVLEASGPADDPGTALAALRAMVEGAAISPTDGFVDPQVQDMVLKAKQAVTALPTIATAAMPGLDSALTLLSDDGTRNWQSPAGSDRMWKLVMDAHAQGRQPQDILPELRALQQ